MGHSESESCGLPALELPRRYNYIAAFLTLACNLRCSFCINTYGDALRRYPTMPASDWLRGLNRLMSRPDLPVTLQGGEPSLHPDFYEIINGLRDDLNIDILTNLQFDVDEFMANVPPDRVKRDAPYASIRVSYHPEVMTLEDMKPKVQRLMDRGYSVGVWAVEHPDQREEIERAKVECERDGIDFRFKEFLGRHDGRLHGTYRYEGAVDRVQCPPVECRTSELILGPGGQVFRCHADLYEGRPPVGNICDAGLRIDEDFRPCDCFGFCNPCDVKIKTDRFQQSGHTSVEIRRCTRE